MMKLIPRIGSLILAFSLACPVLAPTSAHAADDEDPTNEIVAYGLLGAVIGILVYLGWQMDKEDRQLKTEDKPGSTYAVSSPQGRLLWVAPGAREGEQIAGLGYGLDF